ncbi:hypothetical protein HYW41_00390 [Candidatus Daviesbacteria bacterium]|nr:hypothetical protein [Candidatus Daviesbacteria bacterium]
MKVKKIKKNYLMLIGLVLVLFIIFFYSTKSTTLLQEISIEPAFPFKTLPPNTYNTDSFSCNSNEDCEINICQCTAMNKKYISPEDRLCTRVCEGITQCINNKCKFKEDKSANCYYSRIICVMGPCNPKRVCSSKNHSLIMAVVNDLSKRLRVDRNTIIVNKVTEVMWSDGSLGCPEPGKMYTQATIGGYKISLSQEDKTYLYHTGPQERFILCENPEKD